MAAGAPMRARWGALFLAYVVLGAMAGAESRFNVDLLKALEVRNLGPFRCGSWVTDFAVPDSPAQAHLYTFYVATRNGGVWKTTNNGTTFQAIFDEQPVLPIGDVAVAPSKPDVVWVGTGEAYCARSSNRGDGVYKSTDGGKTWRNMGLRDSHHIARIVIHPTNPDIVYVAAMGHLFTTNVERGVVKTVDGGQTRQKSLYISERVGVIDLVMDASSPGILYAAAYEKERLPWHFEEGGPESAAQGAVLAELEGPGEPGINTVEWDMKPAKASDAVAHVQFVSVAPVEPGEYTVTLEAGGKKLTRKALIRGRTGWSIGPHPADLSSAPRTSTPPTSRGGTRRHRAPRLNAMTARLAPETTCGRRPRLGAPNPKSEFRNPYSSPAQYTALNSSLNALSICAR